MIESSLYSLIELVFCVYLAFLIFLFLLVFIIIVCSECDHHHENNDALVIITTNPDLLRSIPIVKFNFKEFKHDVECVVCLSELVDGDKVRVLPNCNHLFHADCIGSWLRSHLTCPICRKRVCPDHRGISPQLGGDDETLTQNHDTRTENPEFPTHSPRNTETVVVEDVACSGENEGPPDLTAVVIDIPAKETARISDNI